MSGWENIPPLKTCFSNWCWCSPIWENPRQCWHNWSMTFVWNDMILQYLTDFLGNSFIFVKLKWNMQISDFKADANKPPWFNWNLVDTNTLIWTEWNCSGWKTPWPPLTAATARLNSVCFPPPCQPRRRGYSVVLRTVVGTYLFAGKV